jgi:hypothetical protein
MPRFYVRSRDVLSPQTDEQAVSHRRTAAALAVAALAAWPGQAAAKGVVTSVKLCGPSACVTITDRAVGVAFEHALGREGGFAPRLAPYVRLTVRPAFFDLRGYLVPGQGIIQFNGTAHQLGPRTASLLRARLAGIAPYRARITRVWIGKRAAPHPGAFAALLGRPGVAMPASVWNHHPVLIAITLAGRTPWNGWGSALYFPQLRLLHVPDGAWVRITAAEARMIAGDRRPPRAGGGGIGEITVGIGAAMVLAALAAVVAVRRRPRRRAQAA